MRKNRGFTLVELIAIIIILSLLILIATPIVSNVIAESKKKSLGVTCQNIYNAVERYYDFQTEDSCFIFDFSKDITNSETIDGIVYQPISKLQLNGSLPREGQAKFCNGIVEVYADDGENTCLVTEEVNNVVSGTIGNVDITASVIENVLLSSTTSTIKVIVKATDEDGKIVKYLYGLNGKDYKESTEPTFEFTKLESNKEYKIYVRVENESGLLSNTIVKKIVTKDLNNPTFSIENQKPDSGYEYFQSQTIKVSHDIQNIVSPVYYFKSTAEATVKENVIEGVCGTEVMPGNCDKDITTAITALTANTWYKAKTNEYDISYEKDGVLYAITGDETNTTVASTYNITNMDTSAPIIDSFIVGSIKTDRATVTALCSDSISGITKYEFSIDNGKTWIDKDLVSSHTFTELKAGQNYVVKVRCTNGSAIITSSGSESSTSIKDVEFKTGEIIKPTFENTSNTPKNGYDWYTDRTITITYSNTGMSSAYYYFKSNVSATVDAGIIKGSCGTTVTPSNCNNETTIELVANTWYITESKNPNIKYVDNGTLYAAVGDGTNLTDTSTYSVSNIDTTGPSVSLKTGGLKSDRVTLTAICEDNESDITKYEFTKDGGTNWTSTGLEASHTYTGLKSGTAYKVGVRCTNGSALKETDYVEIKPELVTEITINNISNTPSSGYDWYTSRVYKITYKSTGVESPIYYFKSNVDKVRVASGVITGSCGTDINPGVCTASDVTELVANTWYRTTSTTPSLTYTIDGTIYAVIGDGTNLSSPITHTVSNIDTATPVAPKITATDGIASNAWHTSDVTLTFSGSSSASGITYYYGTGIDNMTSKGDSVSITNETDGIRYYVKACNGAGTCSETSNYNVKLDKSTPMTPTITANDGGATGTWHKVKTTLTFSGVSSTSGITYYYGTGASNINTAGSSVTISSNTAGTTYYVKACNGAGVCGNASSYVLVLDVTVPTVSISKSVSGNKNVFTASVSPTSTISGYTYEWYKNDTKISGATSLTYTTSESGTFKIKVTTGAGNSTSSSATTISSYTVSYNANGGSGAPTSQTKIQDLTLTLSSTKPSRSGYEFLGWGTTSSDTTVDYSAGSAYTTNASKTLYAIWKVNYYCSIGELSGSVCIESNAQLYYTRIYYTRSENSFSCSTTANKTSCTASGSTSGLSYTTCSDDGYTNWSSTGSQTVSSCSGYNTSTSQCSGTLCTTCSSSGGGSATTYTATSYTRTYTTTGGKWCTGYSYTNTGESYQSDKDESESPCTGTTNCRYKVCVNVAEGVYMCYIKKPSSCTGFSSVCSAPSNFTSEHVAGFDYQICNDGSFYGSWTKGTTSSGLQSCSGVSSLSSCSGTSCTICSSQTSTIPTTYTKYSYSRDKLYSQTDCSRSSIYGSWVRQSSESGLTSCTATDDSTATTWDYDCSSYYACPSGWTTYSGSGSTMKCQQPASTS